MDYFAKKQWIRIAICAVLVAAIVLAMTGVFSGTESLKYDPSAKKLAAGESEAEAAMQGFGGDVTAHLVLEGNTVKELTIDTPNETEGLGKRASDAEFTDQFIGKDGPFTFGENGVEALSGATVTSTAALKAINKAITGEEAAEEPAAEERAKEPEAAAADENAITATEQGFGGDVTVHVTLDGDKIQALLSYHNQQLIRPTLSVSLAKEVPFFDDKIAMLLSLVDETSSVRTACQRMQISYSTGWNIIRTMESQFSRTLIERSQGGARGGQSRLTEDGRRLIDAFRRFENDLRKTAAERFDQYFDGIL